MISSGDGEGPSTPFLTTPDRATGIVRRDGRRGGEGCSSVMHFSGMRIAREGVHTLRWVYGDRRAGVSFCLVRTPDAL